MLHKSGQLTEPQATGGPLSSWKHRKIYDNVIKSLHALPNRFKTSLQISDFRATDIFTLNTALGATIEDAVVNGLNSLREIWDSDGKYSNYRFDRQPQAFPDVRLITDTTDNVEIIMGIELKGWFALAKEGEPTFRYTINPKACAEADLLVIFPWLLSDVIAGTPKLLSPYIGEARYAAELRNYYWQDMRKKQNGDGTIITSNYQNPYPALKTDQCSDRANNDGGGNFGRIARYGLLDKFIKATVKQEVSGIPIRAWIEFFKIFGNQTHDLDALSNEITKTLNRYIKEQNSNSVSLLQIFEQIVTLLKHSE